MKILLAIDNSPYSAPAVNAAAARPWPAGSVIRVLTVVDSVLPVVPEVALAANFEETHEALRNDAKATVQRAANGLERLGVRVETRIRNGHASAEIVEEAKDWEADLVLVGSHGRTGLKRVLMGSVAEHVVAHAPCSVEVVRATKAELAAISGE